MCTLYGVSPVDRSLHGDNSQLANTTATATADISHAVLTYVIPEISVPYGTTLGDIRYDEGMFMGFRAMSDTTVILGIWG